MHDPRTTTALVLATLALAGGAAWYGLADHGAEPVLQESADDDGLGDVRVITRAESLAAQEGAAQDECCKSPSEHHRNHSPRRVWARSEGSISE